MRSNLALLAACALVLSLIPWSSPADGAQAPVVAGRAQGSLWIPSLSSIGTAFGSTTSPSGQVHVLSASLEPDLYGSSTWTGFSPTGEIVGTLGPAGGGPILSFKGTYATTVDGYGTFRAWVTQPLTVPGPPILVGSIEGDFRDAAKLDPQTLLPIPGGFTGTWTAGL